MAQAIYYCEKCARLIDPGEIARGQALVLPRGAVCAACAATLSPQERAALRGAVDVPPAAPPRAPTARVVVSPPGGPAARPSGVARASGRSRRLSAALPDEADEAAAKPKTGILLAGIGAGVLAGVVLVFVLSSDPSKTGPAPPAPPAVDAPAPEEPPVPAPTATGADPAAEAGGRESLARIRRRIEPSFGHYGDIRRELENFIRKSEGLGVAAEATQVLQKLDIDYAKLAEEELDLAVAAARQFTSQGNYDQALSMVRSVRSRFGEGPWLASKGEARINAAEAEIAEARAAKAEQAAASVKDLVAKGDAALARDDIAGARKALAGRGAWPEEDRRRAEEILKKIDEREKALAAERERQRAWPDFLVAFAKAGAEGVAGAEALLAEKEAGLDAVGLEEKVARLRGLIRDAEFTESVAVEGFLATRSRARLHWNDKPYTGRILKIEDRVITLKPVVGDPVEIPLDGIGPEEVAGAAGLLKGDAGSKLRAASYYVVRADLEAARKVLEEVTGDKAAALREDIEDLADAIAAAAPPEAPETVVAHPAGPEPAPAAPEPGALRRALSIEPAGNMKLGSARIYINYAGPGWKSGAGQEGTGVVEPEQGFPAAAGGKWETRGKFVSKSTPATFDFRQTIQDVDADSVKYSALLTSDAGVETEALFLAIGFPTAALAGKEVLFDGQAKVFPSQHQGQVVFSQNARRIVVPVAGGRMTIEGSFYVFVQDERTYNNDGFTIRLFFKTDAKAVKKGELDFTMRLEGEGGAATSVASLVTNGSMTAGGAAPDGWTTFTGEGKHTLVRDTASFAKGPASACLVSETDASYGDMEQVFRPTGKTFTISGFARCEGNLTECTVAVIPRDEKGNNKGYLSVFEVLGKGEWTEFSKQIAIPDGVAKCQLMLITKGKGKGWLDEVRVEEERVAAVTPAKAPGGAGPEPAPQAGPKEALPGETGMPGQWAPGLICEMFAGPDFKTRLGARIDPQIDYFLGNSGIDPVMDHANRTIRWTGWILIPSDGKYVFEVECQKSQMDLTIDGTPVLKKDGPRSGLEEEFKAGLHPIAVTYYGKDWWGQAKLVWIPPWADRRAIPAEFFFHEVPEPGTNGPHAKLVQGMWAEYFSGDNFEQKVAENAVAVPSYDLGTVPPVPGLSKSRWSARFSGYALVEMDGEIGLGLSTESGVRLRLDDQVLINQWENNEWKDFKAKKQVKKGFRKVVIEFRYRGKNAKLFTKYSLAHGDRNNPKDVWPGALFMDPRKPQLISRKGVAPGLKGGLFAGEKPGGRPVLRHYSPAAWLDWKGQSPGAPLPVDGFSGLWEGVILAPESGRYIFRAHQKGGLMFTIGGRQVISKWKPVEDWDENSVPLRRGPNPVTLAYFKRSGDSLADIWWSGPGFGLRRLSSDVLGHSAAKLAMAEPWKPSAPAPVAGGGQAPGQPAQPGQPGQPDEKPAGERPPPGNLIANGGFEERDEEAKFAARWTKGQWGKRGAKYSVRLDKSNPHAGESAMSVRGLEEGAEAGVSASLKLLPAKYEVRLWACAGVGETANVQVSLGGRDLPAETVGDTYKQLVGKVEITKKELQGVLRIRVTSSTARVWLDDVEVEAVQ